MPEKVVPLSPNVRARVITIRRESELTQKSLGDPVNPSKRLVVDAKAEEDIFGRDIIAPPYDLYGLAKFPHMSSILPQCIAAMEVNIESYGHDLMYVGPEDKDQSQEAQAEKEMIEAFLMTVNDRESFVNLRRKRRKDMEITGNAYWEVIRDTAGDVAGFEHLPSVTMRLCRQDDVPVEVETEMLGPNGTIVKRRGMRRFRRMVQTIGDQRRVYFKEFGDERVLNAKTGKYDDNTIPEEEANECLHFPIFDPCSVYGIPRWIGVLPAILGSRFAEMVNLKFWEKQGIPAMAVLVSGGALTPESMEILRKVFEEEALGGDNFHRVVVLEGMPVAGSIEDKSSVRIDMRPLQGERQQDSVFRNYDIDNINKIRSAFRLPPLFVGRTEDTNYATAMSAQMTAEEQVFVPERQQFDEIMNLKVLRSLGVKYWSFYSKGPEIADMNTFTAAVQVFCDVGALTPNAAIGLMNELLGTEVEEIDEEWGNLPFQIVKILATAGTLSGLDDYIDKQVQTMQLQPKGPPEVGPDGKPKDAEANTTPGGAPRRPATGLRPTEKEPAKASVQRLEDIEQKVAMLLAQSAARKRSGQLGYRTMRKKPKRRYI
jgi:PBSX family phage portal protein